MPTTNWLSRETIFRETFYPFLGNISKKTTLWSFLYLLTLWTSNVSFIFGVFSIPAGSSNMSFFGRYSTVIDCIRRLACKEKTIGLLIAIFSELTSWNTMFLIVPQIKSIYHGRPHCSPILCPYLGVDG